MLIDWVTGATSLTMFILYGNKWKYAPVVGVIQQVPWFIFVWAHGAWGLLPSVIVFTVVHIRNAVLWTRVK